MGTIKLSHVNIQGTNCAIFLADAAHPGARPALLGSLVEKARQSGLAVEKAALQYGSRRRIEWFGTPDLVRYLRSVGGVTGYTHQIHE